MKFAPEAARSIGAEVGIPFSILRSLGRVLLAAILLAPFAAARDPGTLRVRLTARDGGKTVDLPLERYVAAVIAGESSLFRSDEALKAMAVAIRTFAIRNRGAHAAEGYDLCGTTHCQLVDLHSVTARLEQAATATAGEFLWYGGKPAYACYSRDCGGRSEDARVLWPDKNLPYLKARIDPYCTRSPAADWQWIGEAASLSKALKLAGFQVPARIDHIAVSKRTASGRASVLSLSGAGQTIPVSAVAFRLAVGRTLGWNTLRSEQWNVHGSDGRFLFQGKGSGHGAGLCQLGADEMGVEGRGYGDILAQYYPGAAIGLTARGLKWTRLGGERVSVMTTRIDRDRAIVAAADRIAASLNLAPGIEIRIYPDVETFRNATAEPGWVAAHTEGRRIHLQPHAAIRRTLRHELLHVLVEDQAAANLPVWFREGLVAFLENRDSTTSARTPDDLALRQTADAAQARKAYTDARRRVAQLVAQYGETTVMTWLRKGLPAGSVTSKN